MFWFEPSVRRNPRWLLRHFQCLCLLWVLPVDYPLILKGAQMLWRSSKGDAKLSHTNWFRWDFPARFWTQRVKFLYYFLQFTTSELNSIIKIDTIINKLMNCFQSQPLVIRCRFVEMQINQCWSDAFSSDWHAASLVFLDICSICDGQYI
jgi:hypothetical protein